MSALLAILLHWAGNATIVATPAVERTCVAIVAYTEARGEGVAGMAAVAAVVRNRTADARWPSTECAVSMQRGQFVGVDNWDPAHVDFRAYRAALAVADIALSGADLVPAQCRGATYFDTGHHRYGRVQLCRIGAHTFYRDSRP